MSLGEAKCLRNAAVAWALPYPVTLDLQLGGFPVVDLRAF